jgi:hypothetical protein
VDGHHRRSRRAVLLDCRCIRSSPQRRSDAAPLGTPNHNQFVDMDAVLKRIS